MGDRTTSLLTLQNSVSLSSDPVANAARENVLETEPGFNNSWYAVAYSEQLGVDDVFATRLWGEPLVLYRASANEAVCVRDSCPHRSAPLSMGDVQDGILRCFYHGWAFGSEGKCVDVPTMGGSTKMLLNCKSVHFATVERDGIVWVWRGHPLAADASKLPRYTADDRTLTIDTVLDYDLEWTNVMESKLASPHLPVGEAAPSSAMDTEFRAPNVAYHQGSGGTLSEESHIVPIAPKRTRVMMRQRFIMDGVLSVALQLPGSLPFLTWCVRNWNYRVATEKYQDLVRDTEMQAKNDIVAAFRSWHKDACAKFGPSYFTRWDRNEVSGFGPQIDDADSGTYGLKKSYVQKNPKVVYAPLRS